MHHRGNAVRRVVLVAFVVIASAAAGRAIHAQTPVIDSVAADRRTPPRQVTVKVGTARVTVYRQGVRAVNVMVRTDSGTFTLSADSAILATWADSAASLPDPPDTGQGMKVSFKMWQIRADGDSGAHMRFVRLPTNHGPDLVLAMFNGAWNGIEYLGSRAPVVLAALRGDSSVAPDSLHAGTILWPKRLHGAECISGESTRTAAGATKDTTCTRSPIAHATQHGHSHHPRYPDDLQRARIEGEATMQFVIDSTGRVDPGTIQLLASTDYRFALACRVALPQMEFSPARVEGRKVPELVQLPFTFAMHTPSEHASK